MDVMSEANRRESAGEDIIHMEVGQPATPAPRAARERVAQAMAEQTLGYTLSLGLPELRERIAAYVRQRYGVGVGAERVIVRRGRSAGFVLAFLAILDHGDGFGLPSPGYPCYRQILKALGFRPHLIETGADGRWMPTAADVEALARSDAAGLLLASPNNPSGTMASGARLKELAEACTRQGLWLISDEIYHGLEYDVAAETALAYSESAIVVNSFSKYFSMTGWRVGWLVVPEALTRTIERLCQNLYIAPPTVSQVAALGAFDGIDELEEIKSRYARSRALLLNELPPAGLPNILPADGAFYLYADISHLTDDSVAFAKAMLRDIGVAATPGVDFDPARGRSYLRLSYAGAEHQMREAAKRIAGWLRTR
ncbi:1-aminocyclopropane-1-carboxylate deaminase [Methyloceanibacter methanicus]|uniref:Aminotransferase n=2 Tax=Methyloceanibacter methanicus TaxID=1774968 RepID=A0A1E3VZT7_9HYPH|nr:aminotransferase class I/II-fold pyridoxal phosphate-dependent enzyme [Methyloceanibacter methanicus]ODR99075.1 1-aminocyclopropane-1-carboxylate deaminase [Methyloceanibacter methanicus]